MRHISIEGMDGVGKTSTCIELAKRLGFKFVEKPLHYLFDDEEDVSTYQRVAKRVNSNEDRTFTAWYYGLNNIYLYTLFKDQNIVTDRHIVSNYCWSGTPDNKDIYDLIIKKIGVPELTVILYAPKEVIIERLMKRDINDKDIKRAELSEKVYERMINFCKEREFPFVVIDTSNLSIDQVVDKIIEELNK